MSHLKAGHIIEEIRENSIIPLERNEVKQERMEQNRMEQNRMEWNRIERNGIK